MLAFQSALLDTVTWLLPAGWLNVTGQPLPTRWLPAKANCRFQPPVIGSPVLVIAMFAPNPLPLSQAFEYCTEQPGAAYANVVGPTTAPTTTSRPVAVIATARAGVPFEKLPRRFMRVDLLGSSQYR